MSIGTAVYNTIGITARADHYDSSHWVDVTFNDREGQFRVSAFFDDPELADRYAAAINGVNLVKPAADRIEDASEPALQIERARQ